MKYFLIVNEISLKPSKGHQALTERVIQIISSCDVKNSIHICLTQKECLYFSHSFFIKITVESTKRHDYEV